jgi:hypothetical protein
MVADFDSCRKELNILLRERIGSYGKKNHPQSMPSFSGKVRRAVIVPAASVLTLASVFFVFYTVRLLVITRGLRSIRAGGGGAYVGAVVFPMLAVLLGWGGWRCVRALRESRNAAKE